MSQWPLEQEGIIFEKQFVLIKKKWIVGGVEGVNPKSLGLLAPDLQVLTEISF